MSETNTDRANAAIASGHAGERSESIAAFRDLVTKEPEDVACSYLLGGFLRAEGVPDGAIPHLQSALRLQPRHRAATETLFEALWESGQEEAGAEVLRRSLRIRHVEELAELHLDVEAHLGAAAD